MDVLQVWRESLAETILKHATQLTIFNVAADGAGADSCAVCWYRRDSLSLRDVEELFAERSGGGSHDDLALGATLR